MICSGAVGVVAFLLSAASGKLERQRLSARPSPPWQASGQTISACVCSSASWLESGRSTDTAAFTRSVKSLIALRVAGVHSPSISWAKHPTRFSWRCSSRTRRSGSPSLLSLIGGDETPTSPMLRNGKAMLVLSGVSPCGGCDAAARSAGSAVLGSTTTGDLASLPRLRAGSGAGCRDRGITAKPAARAPANKAKLLALFTVPRSPMTEDRHPAQAG